LESHTKKNLLLAVIVSIGGTAFSLPFVMPSAWGQMGGMGATGGPSPGMAPMAVMPPNMITPPYYVQGMPGIVPGMGGFGGMPMGPMMMMPGMGGFGGMAGMMMM
jgi:hypothetical protein